MNLRIEKSRSRGDEDSKILVEAVSRYYRPSRLYFLAERAPPCLYKMEQLCLTDAQIAYEVTHLTAEFIEISVVVFKFHVTQKRRNRRENHRQEGFSHRLRGV